MRQRIVMRAAIGFGFLATLAGCGSWSKEQNPGQGAPSYYNIAPASAAVPTPTTGGCADKGGGGAARCATAKVFVHYGLATPYPEAMTVQVEAFDNKSFSGAPVASTQIFGFPARAGEWREASLSLAPGQYFIRAYMSNEQGTPPPYMFGDLQVVANHPMGILGVLANPQPIVVTDAASDAAPVDLVMDQLFTKPGSAPPTNAVLRIELKAADLATVPTGRDVRVELRKTESLDTDPAYVFKVPSDLFLVQGKGGATEFVSPSMDEGNYTVLAYVDTNGNGFLDPTEPQLLYRELGAVKMVEIRKDAVRTISMLLAVPPAP